MKQADFVDQISVSQRYLSIWHGRNEAEVEVLNQSRVWQITGMVTYR